MATRTTSAAGIGLIKRYEGFSADIYRCPAGLPTIGHGHVVRKLDRLEPPITPERALSLLLDDLSPIEVYLSGVAPDIPQHQFDALASLAINIGLGALDRSTLLRKLKAGDVAGAADEFLRWNQSKGQILAGLVRRRADERALFLGAAYA